MGYQIVSIVLRDGRRFERVAVVGGAIGSVPGFDTVPFVENDIEQIVVTHDRSSTA